MLGWRAVWMFSVASVVLDPKKGLGVMNYSVLPPEINSLRMFSGAGSAPMLEAAVAWEGLAAELGLAAESFGSVTSGLAGGSWQGSAAAAMLAAAAPYAGWLSAAAARAAGAAGQAKVVAGVFEAARAAMVPPPVIAANRNAFVQLVLSNVFGQNAPAIAAAEGFYEEMWAADVAAMVGYHGGAAAAAAALPSWQQGLAGLPGLSQAVGPVAAASAAAARAVAPVGPALAAAGAGDTGDFMGAGDPT